MKIKTNTVKKVTQFAIGYTAGAVMRTIPTSNTLDKVLLMGSTMVVATVASMKAGNYITETFEDYEDSEGKVEVDFTL